jgi:hypothetical protein
MSWVPRHAGLEQRNGLVPGRAGLHDVEMGLAASLRISYPGFQDILSLFDKLPVEVNGVTSYATGCIVLPKNVLGRLFVIPVCLSAVTLPFLRQSLCFSAITALIRLLRLEPGEVSLQRMIVIKCYEHRTEAYPIEARAALSCSLPGQVA